LQRRRLHFTTSDGRILCVLVIEENAVSPSIEDVITTAGFDEWDVDAGTAGFCAAFAMAMKSRFPSVTLGVVCYANDQGLPRRARDGGLLWRHAVAIHEGRLYDITGHVELADLIENHCWDNRSGKGGVLVPIGEAEMLHLAISDGPVSQARMKDWGSQLHDAATHRSEPYRPGP
jgi:hypothetical protein